MTCERVLSKYKQGEICLSVYVLIESADVTQKVFFHLKANPRVGEGCTEVIMQLLRRLVTLTCVLVHQQSQLVDSKVPPAPPQSPLWFTQAIPASADSPAMSLFVFGNGFQVAIVVYVTR